MDSMRSQKEKHFQHVYGITNVGLMLNITEVIIDLFATLCFFVFFLCSFKQTLAELKEEEDLLMKESLTLKNVCFWRLLYTFTNH